MLASKAFSSIQTSDNRIKTVDPNIHKIGSFV